MKDDTEPKSETPAPTECDGQPLLFTDFGPRPVVVDFNGGDVSSDGRTAHTDGGIMINLSPATRIFVALAPVDMRQGFNGLVSK